MTVLTVIVVCAVAVAAILMLALMLALLDSRKIERERRDAAAFRRALLGLICAVSVVPRDHGEGGLIVLNTEHLSPLLRHYNLGITLRNGQLIGSRLPEHLVAYLAGDSETRAIDELHPSGFPEYVARAIVNGRGLLARDRTA